MGRLLRHIITEVKIVTRKIQKSNRPIKTDKLSTFFKNLTKGKIRVTFDESYFHEQGIEPEEQKYYELAQARNGYAYLLSEEKGLMAFYAPAKITANKIIASIPESYVHTETDIEMVVAFPKSVFWDVGKIVHFRRKRRVSPEQIEASTKRFAEYRKRQE